MQQRLTMKAQNARYRKDLPTSFSMKRMSSKIKPLFARMRSVTVTIQNGKHT